MTRRLVRLSVSDTVTAPVKKKDAYNLAVVGATGAVGVEILRVLERRNFPVAEVKLLASSRSAGKTLEFSGGNVEVQEVSHEAFEGVDIAFFSAGATRSREFAPSAVKAGAVVVDNSSAFRMQEDVPLVVPEVNPEDLGRHSGIVANPNCCAAILVVPLKALHDAAGLRSVTVSTYQSASGAGAQAMAELEEQVRQYARGEAMTNCVFPHQIAFNVFSHNSAMAENGFNDEENKLVQETQKILHLPQLPVLPTCVRVPVLRAHSEAVVIETERPLSREAAQEALAKFPGIRIVDDAATSHFPMPIEASGELDVLVGRVRNASGDDRKLAFFVSGDQLLKGAAWNAVQIAECLIASA